jgi:hypothetical protein
MTLCGAKFVHFFRAAIDYLKSLSRSLSLLLIPFCVQNEAFGSHQDGTKLAKSPVPTAGRAGSPLPAVSHGRFSALRGLSALPRIDLDAALGSHRLE